MYNVGMSNWVPILVNVTILVVTLIGTLFLTTKVKFEDSNYKLLFILYLMYWIAPMMLRQYTGKIHGDLIKAGYDSKDLLDLLWVPTFVYGITGIFWKPLADFLVTKFKSRKSIIFISLVIQFVGVIPMIIKPCFITNLIQAVCVGVGASCISMFTLMFNEQYSKKKVFATVSLLSLPPMIAEFASATFISIVTSFVNEKDEPTVCVSKLKWIWIIGLMLIILTFVVAFFLKENKELVFADNKYKEPIKNNWEVISALCVIFIASLAGFVKYCTSGGSMLSEMKFIAKHDNKGEIIDTFSAYLSPILYLGRTTANLLTGFVLVKKYKKSTLFVFATSLWLLFAILSAIFISVEAKFILIIINGFCFGMVTNLSSSAMMKKYFAKTAKITPITLLSILSSVGVVIGSFLNTFVKKPLLNKDTKIVDAEDWKSFMQLNWKISSVIIAAIVLMCLLFLSQDFILKKQQQQSSQPKQPQTTTSSAS